MCQERGWKEYEGTRNSSDSAPWSVPADDYWNLWWKSTGFSLSHYKQQKIWQVCAWNTCVMFVGLYFFLHCPLWQSSTSRELTRFRDIIILHVIIICFVFKHQLILWCFYAPKLNDATWFRSIYRIQNNIIIYNININFQRRRLK